MEQERIWGSRTYITKPADLRFTDKKLHNTRGWIGYFVGCENESTHRIWDPERRQVIRTAAAIVEDGAGLDDDHDQPGLDGHVLDEGNQHPLFISSGSEASGENNAQDINNNPSGENRQPSIHKEVLESNERNDDAVTAPELDEAQHEERPEPQASDEERIMSKYFTTFMTRLKRRHDESIPEEQLQDDVDETSSDESIIEEATLEKEKHKEQTECQQCIYLKRTCFGEPCRKCLMDKRSGTSMKNPKRIKKAGRLRYCTFHRANGEIERFDMTGFYLNEDSLPTYDPDIETPSLRKPYKPRIITGKFRKGQQPGPLHFQDSDEDSDKDQDEESV
ncbi:MAG: hypothetical protein M1833_002381 [Piccolia ochrophora]|nr:MAG: hypothetical protein M1833_002381 [Piccolia ochrophora]